MKKDTFWKNLMSLVLPVAFQQFMLALVSASDALMLGMQSQDSLSSVSLASQITFVQNLFLAAMTIGLSTIAAQYWGKKDIDTVERIFAYVMKLTAVVSFLFFLAALCLPETLMRIFTNDSVMLAGGAAYLRAVSLSYLLTGISQVYLCILKNSGRAALASKISSFSVVFNIGCNALLIFGLFGFPRLEITGAAYATVLARVIEVVWSVLVSEGGHRKAGREPVSASASGGQMLAFGQPENASGGKMSAYGQIANALSGETSDYGQFANASGPVIPCIRLRPCYLRKNDARLCHDFWVCTMPVLGNEIVWGVGFTMYSVIMGHLGSDAVAANSIAGIVKNLAACLCLGLGAGGGILIGNLLGAGKLSEAKDCGARLCHLSILCGVFSGLILVLLTPLIVRAAGLSDQASAYLRVILFTCSYYMTGRAINSTTISGIFCAGGDTRFGFLCDLITMWCIVVPLGFLAAFVLKLPVSVVCVILTIDEMVKLPAVYRHYRKYRWVKNLTVQE